MLIPGTISIRSSTILTNLVQIISRAKMSQIFTAKLRTSEVASYNYTFLRLAYPFQSMNRF